MNITENTTIKELAPEGMKYVSSLRGDDYITINFEAKQKDFDTYIKEYLTPFLSSELGQSFNDKMIEFYNKKDYSNIPFEIKIGLLKFICDDLKINWYSALIYKYNNLKWYKEIKNICPKDFLNSIFE